MDWLSNLFRMSPARTWQLVFISIGCALMIYGLWYMLLPLLFGTLLNLVGLYILLRTSSIARRLFVRLMRRHPAVFAPLRRLRRRRRK